MAKTKMKHELQAAVDGIIEQLVRRAVAPLMVAIITAGLLANAGADPDHELVRRYADIMVDKIFQDRK